MKALVWTATEQMRWQEAVEPRQDRTGWVLVEPLMTGICGSEVAAFLGHNELRTPPLIMGHEFSGRLVEKDAERGLNRGDVVTVNPLVSCGQCRACVSGQRQQCRHRAIIGINFPGAFGQKVAVPASQIYPVQDALAGALVEPLACAVRAVHQAKVQLGDQVVVWGAGIIGLMAAAVARAQGAGEVVVVDPNPSRLGTATSWGASQAISADDAVTTITAMAPDGVDCVIDAVGLASTRRDGVKLLRRGGRATWIGLHENMTTFDGNAVVRDEVEIAGSFCYTDAEFRQAVTLANQHFTERPGAWVDVRPAAEGNEAFAEQARGRAPFAKIVLAMTEEG